jgi:hypothetical protein
MTQAIANQSAQLFAVAEYDLFAPGGISHTIAGPSQTRDTRTFARVPEGEMEVSQTERIVAQDGAVGRLRGVVIDQTFRQVTHVLLAAGHVWGRRKLAIPIANIEWRDHAVHINLTKEQVGALEPVDRKNGWSRHPE